MFMKFDSNLRAGVDTENKTNTPIQSPKKHDGPIFPTESQFNNQKNAK